MAKLYVLSERPDAEVEKIIYEMDSYYLRIFLYGIARGWGFDESLTIAEDGQKYENDKREIL